jgi:hypothetical protein
VFKVFSPKVFNPNNSTEVTGIQRGLQDIITLGFQCLNDSSNPQCSPSARRRRQTCPSYTVNIIQPITLVSKQREYFIELIYMIHLCCFRFLIARLIQNYTWSTIL